MAEYKNPTDLMGLTKNELAYKLALMQSFVAEIDAESYLPRFERKYSDWWNGIKEPAMPVSIEPARVL